MRFLTAFAPRFGIATAQGFVADGCMRFLTAFAPRFGIATAQGFVADGCMRFLTAFGMAVQTDRQQRKSGGGQDKYLFAGTFSAAAFPPNLDLQ